MGRDRADELVDDRQSLPRAREHGVTSSPRTRARACDTIRRTHGPAAVRSSTSTAGCSPRRRPGPASGSSSRRSTSPPCVTSARRGAAITCWRTCAPRRIRSMRGTSIRPPDTSRRRRRYERNVELIRQAKSAVEVDAWSRCSCPTLSRTRSPARIANLIEAMRQQGAEYPQIWHLFAYLPSATDPSRAVHAGDPSRAVAAQPWHARADRGLHVEAQRLPVLNRRSRRSCGGVAGRRAAGSRRAGRRRVVGARRSHKALFRFIDKINHDSPRIARRISMRAFDPGGPTRRSISRSRSARSSTSTTDGSMRPASTRCPRRHTAWAVSDGDSGLCA